MIAKRYMKNITDTAPIVAKQRRRYEEDEMRDCIYREDAIKAFESWDEYEDEIRKIIESIPSADVAEQSEIDSIVQTIVALERMGNKRKRGEWQITSAYPHNVHCSECGKRFAQTHWGVWEDGSLPRNFCPNCGAKLKGAEE